jgi:D-alanyl-D-alanine dipeptidase
LSVRTMPVTDDRAGSSERSESLLRLLVPLLEPPGGFARRLASALCELEAPPALASLPPVRPAWLDPAEPLVPIDTGGGDRLWSLPWYHRRGLPAPETVLVREGVRDRLLLSAGSLPDTLSLVVLDGWRPRELQRELHAEAYRSGVLPSGFVADPDDVCPPHLSGGTVDVTVAFEGIPLGLGTGFDEFTAAAHLVAFEDTPGPVADLRRMLTAALGAGRFTPLWCEWWHFDSVAGAVRYGPLEAWPAR